MNGREATVMMPAPSDDVADRIAGMMDAVSYTRRVEVLGIFAAEPQREFRASEIAQATGMAVYQACQYLSALQRHKAVAVNHSDESRYPTYLLTNHGRTLWDLSRRYDVKTARGLATESRFRIVLAISDKGSLLREVVAATGLDTLTVNTNFRQSSNHGIITRFHMEGGYVYTLTDYGRKLRQAARELLADAESLLSAA